jgi:hypothetical protein
MEAKETNFSRFQNAGKVGREHDKMVTFIQAA